jgi:hypothetical protein
VRLSLPREPEVRAMTIASIKFQVIIEEIETEAEGHKGLQCFCPTELAAAGWADQVLSELPPDKRKIAVARIYRLDRVCVREIRSVVNRPLTSSGS